MKNMIVSGLFDFNNLGEAGKQVLVDLLYPVGSYFSNDSEKYDTVEKVESHFGGKWERITGKILYATEDNNAGTDSGSNFITLTTSQIPSHNHTFTGNKMWGKLSTSGQTLFKTSDGQNAVIGEGVLSVSNTENTKYAGNSTGSSGKIVRELHFNGYPSGSISNTGNGAQIDIRPARRNTYCYHRIG